MTPLGVRALSRPAVPAERHARVALGRVFRPVGPFELLDAPGVLRGRAVPGVALGTGPAWSGPSPTGRRVLRAPYVAVSSCGP